MNGVTSTRNWPKRPFEQAFGERHGIDYLFDDEEVRVAGILHGRMDAATHFGS
jgi:plasmid stabilization system protein ParE